MTAVLHVLDGACDETQWQVLDALRARLSDGGDHHAVCAIDPQALGVGQVESSRPADSRFRRFDVSTFRRLDRLILRAEQRLWSAMNYAPRLPTMARECGAQIIHAWGPQAAAVACARLPAMPLVVTLLDPHQARDSAGRLHSLPEWSAVIVGSQVARKQLVTAGVPPERVVVIRGPADFSAINKARAAGLRTKVVGDSRPVVLMTGPPSHAGGQFYGLWAAAIVRQVIPSIRVLMPYQSAESARLRRFVDQIEMSDMLVVPDAALTWPQLVTCADAFLCPAREEVATEPIAVAMAAGLVIVGTAVRSVAELIADKSNGLLCKPNDPRALAGRLLTALEDADLGRRVTEVARGQAYEVFSPRAFADNYARVYENILAHRPCADAVHDTAYEPA